MNEDENDCTINSTHCKGSYISCRDSAICIQKRDICNGINDCGNNWDEMKCLGSCNSNQFLCRGEDRCINLASVCDGYSSCKNNQDELNCPPTCDADEFHCTISKKCIKRNKMCDGFDHCSYNEDETNCFSKGVMTNETNVSEISHKLYAKIPIRPC